MIIDDKVALIIAFSIVGIIIWILFLFSVTTEWYWIIIMYSILGFITGVVYGSTVKNFTVFKLEDKTYKPNLINGEPVELGKQGDLREQGEQGEPIEQGEQGDLSEQAIYNRYGDLGEPPFIERDLIEYKNIQLYNSAYLNESEFNDIFDKFNKLKTAINTLVEKQKVLVDMFDIRQLVAVNLGKLDSNNIKKIILEIMGECYLLDNINELYSKRKVPVLPRSIRCDSRNYIIHGFYDGELDSGIETFIDNLSIMKYYIYKFVNRDISPNSQAILSYICGLTGKLPIKDKRILVLASMFYAFHTVSDLYQKKRYISYNAISNSDNTYAMSIYTILNSNEW